MTVCPWLVRKDSAKKPNARNSAAQPRRQTCLARLSATACHPIHRGEDLIAEEDPVLVACGRHLVEIAKVLNDIDRMICGDDAREGMEEARRSLVSIIGTERVMATAVDTLESAIKRAQGVVALIETEAQ